MATTVKKRDTDSLEIICRFCPHPRYPDEGYYQLQTTDGDFLGNIGSDELDYELSSFREQGYSLARIIEC